MFVLVGFPIACIQVSTEEFIVHGRRNNAWCRMPGWDISILGLDYLHIMDLGLAPEIGASAPCMNTLVYMCAVGIDGFVHGGCLVCRASEQ